MHSFICLKQIHQSFKISYIFTKHTKSAFLNKYYSDSKIKGDRTSPDSSKKLTSEEIKASLEPPEEPTTCCMSGCANCVWLDYAEALCKYFQDGGEKAIKEINERISDPNIKAYILHEIRMRNKNFNWQGGFPAFKCLFKVIIYLVYWLYKNNYLKIFA